MQRLNRSSGKGFRERFPQREKRPRLSILGSGLLLCLAPACASLDVDRDTETTGTFVSKGWSFTILSIDLPQPALDIARENASDTRLANLVVEDASVYPYLGPFDWLLDIIGVRRAVVRGRWGYAE